MNNNDYLAVVDEIKARIHAARHRALLSANSDLILLYWDIGSIINERSVWGNKFVENLSRDIKMEFPNATGYSPRNLRYMAAFAKAYPDKQLLQTLSAKLPWSHNTALLDKVKADEERLWYIQQTIENGWSLDGMVCQIERNLYQRQVLSDKTTNYDKRLPDPHSKLAIETIRDPYIFDFIEDSDDLLEPALENQLVRNVTKLLLELGSGFAFVGNQYHIEVEGEDFYIDLLFYHLKLRCFVVVELKSGTFKPEFAGKLNFYVSAVDDLLASEGDNSTIGILLCKDKRGMIAEYSLKDIEKPIGVSEYRLHDKLPAEYKDLLPTAEDIMSRINQKDSHIVRPDDECASE